MNDRDLLRCLISVVGRVALPADDVRTVVGAGKNRIKAFNLCDGRKTVKDIARETQIDQGNLSRAASTWVEHGVAFWVGEGKEARLLHIYPVPERERNRGKGRKEK